MSTISVSLRSVAALGALMLMSASTVQAGGGKGHHHFGFPHHHGHHHHHHGWYRAAPFYYPRAYAVPVYTPPMAAPFVDAAPVVSETTTADLVEQAKRELKARDYDAASATMDRVLQREPKNSELLQFQSLVAFARGDHRTAAAMAYSGLALGPSFDWNAVQQLYPGTKEYSGHYYRLSAEAKAKPDQADLQFLMAYHHLLLGHRQQGRQSLEAAKTLLPEDALIPQLLAQTPAE